MPSQTLVPLATARAESATPNRALGNELKRLVLDDTEATSFIKFPEPDAIRGRAITRARLMLRPIGAGWSSTRTVAAQPHERWDYRTITWGYRPDVLAGTTEASGTKSGTTPLYLDLLEHVQAWSAGEIEWDGWKLTTTSTVSLLLGGMGDDFAASLLLEWKDAPQPPIGLDPDGGVTAATHPDLSWDSAGPAVTTAQVQFGSVDVDGVWVSAWDSGLMAVQSAGMALSRTDFAVPFPGLDALGLAEPLWRVREWWSDGQVTDYSEAATLAFVAYPALSTPALGTVGDAFPSREWSTSAQHAARVARYDVVTDRRVFLSDILGPSVRIFEPNRGARSTPQSFRDEVMVLDRPDRLDLPGFPAYQRVSDTWTFDASDDGSVVTQIRMEQAHDDDLGALPWGWFVVSCSSVPDSLTIFRGEDQDPVFIDTDTGGPNYIGGTTWRVRTFMWPPNTDKDVAVVARVGTQRLKPVRQSLRLDVEGIWITHTDDDGVVTQVTLDGIDGLEFVEKDVLIEYELADGRVVIRRTGRTGKNGPLSGQIRRKENLSIEDQWAAWEKLRRLADLGETFRIVTLRDNFEARLHSMVGRGDASAASTVDVPINVSAEVRGVPEDD